MPYWHLECSISYVMAVARIAWSKEQIADCDVAKPRERFFRNLLQYGHYIRVSTFLRASVAETCIVVHRNARNLASRQQLRAASGCLLYSRTFPTQAKHTRRSFHSTSIITPPSPSATE